MTTFPADPYGRTVSHGHPCDNATAAFLLEMEAELGFELTVYQIIGGAPQSAGTHLDGRMFDLAPVRALEKLKVADDMGGWGWHRPFDWDGHGGIEHLHIGVILFNRQNQRGIAPAGFRQLASWDDRRNGLVSDLPDNSYRPSPKRAFQYPPKEQKPVPTKTNVTEARDEIVEAIHQIDLACQSLIAADPSRKVAKGQVDDLQAVKHQARAVLEALPKR